MLKGFATWLTVALLSRLYAGKLHLAWFKDKGCNMTWTYLYIDDEQSRLCFDALAIISQMRVIYAL